MDKRVIGALSLLALLVTGVAAIPAQAQGSAALAPQVNRDGGVTVKVTPLPIEPGSWRFEVVLDTHSVDLIQNIVETAVLIDDEGMEHKPSAWEGDPPGGHHRKGVLKFEGIPKAIVIRLEIRQVGIPKRRFTWPLPK